MYLSYRKSVDPAWAWEAYQPSNKNPWTLEKAGHLFRRAAFGGSWTELQSALSDGPSKTVDKLLNPPSAKSNDFYQQTDKLAEPLLTTTDDQRARAWWLYVLLNSPHPLLEKLTLFWHNHFATSNSKVRDVGAMLRQNQLLRKNALGKFGTMLQDVAKDPAMLVWLDGVTNKKGKPNENFARELMELFSLGIGNYSEHDIREAARAFTGWGIKSERFNFEPSEHDDEKKAVFGQTGTFSGEDIVKLCLDKPCCAQFLVCKLMRYLISETLQPAPELVEPLAKQFRDSGYDIKAMVGVILRSNIFFSTDAYRARVKPPVEFAVGIIHALEGRADAIQLAEILDPLGQRLFDPPSVKGWDGSSTWLNSTTLLLRHNLAAALTSTEDRRFYNRCDPVRVAHAHLSNQDADPEKAVGFFLDLLLQGDVPPAAKSKIVERTAELHRQKYPAFWTKDFIAEHTVRSLCHLILTLPEFQLS